MTTTTSEDDLGIGEMATASGLSIHTLRYYERVGLIAPIRRLSSGHRRYSRETAMRVESLGYLRATGLGIEGMRTYLRNLDRGDVAAPDHAELLRDHAKSIDGHIEQLRLRRDYIEAKAAYWQAVADGHGDEPDARRHIERAERLSRGLKGVGE